MNDNIVKFTCCNFCGISSRTAKLLIKSDTAAICDKCVDECSLIIREKLEDAKEVEDE